MSETNEPGYDPRGSLVGGSALLDVVGALLSAGREEGLRVLELGEHFATLVGRSQRPIRVFVTPAQETAILQIVEQMLEHNTRAGSELVFVGGPPQVAEVIRRALPELLMNPFVVFHVADGGKISGFPEARAKKSRRLATLGSARRLTGTERDALVRQVEVDAKSFLDERNERARFFRGVNATRPVVTFALLGAIGVMFLLQTAWTPMTTTGEEMERFFLAMGALSASRVEDGEWWRMISVGFLHGGLLHVGMNGFVLYLLGGQVERVIGSPRFLLLYTLSLLGGSFASMQGGAALSVGASGAVWGLLGAQVSLAYGRPPVLPPSLAEGIKPLVKQNILLNLGISFLPGIDAAAHIGGGLTGGLILASGILYPKTESVPADTKRFKPKEAPVWILALAAGSAALLCYGVLMALLEGRPYALSGASLSLQRLFLG